MVDVVLDLASCSSVGVLMLHPGEHITHVLEHAQLRNDVGKLLCKKQDVSGSYGTLHATTQRLAWLEDGASNLDAKCSCSFPLAALQDVAMSALLHLLPY